MSLRARSTRSPSSRAHARAALNRPWGHVPHAVLDPLPWHPARTTAVLVVLETQAVGNPPPASGIHHWEIACGLMGDVPHLAVATNHESLYQAALKVEGLDRRVRITFHQTEYHGVWVNVLDTIDEVAP